MRITNADSTTPFTSPHGEIVREYFGEAAGGAAQHSLAHITLPPGTTSRKHYHPTVEESYFILAGEGRMTVDSESRIIKPGDAISIPVNAVHQIFNDTNAPLTFLAICAPSWTPDCSIFLD
jgi:mannose-6-phosphate isomerase-like protein (cupin superfamily)